MKVKIIVSKNPFFSSSAGANRLLSLIEGLVSLKVKVDLLITHGFQNEEERRSMPVSGSIKGVDYFYLTTTLSDTLWKRRIEKYIINRFRYFILRKKIKSHLSGFKGLVWPENDLTLWRILDSYQSRSFKLFAEMSEFLDIHKYNNVRKIHIIQGDRSQYFFENTFLLKLDGLALMTKTLLKHYESFESKPALCHLSMTVDLDRFDRLESDLVASKLRKPYIAFIGVMDNRKDGVNILIDAFANIHNEFPEYSLYLFGYRNYDTPGHLQQIKELKLEEKIEWMREVSRDEIPSILLGSDLLVLPRPDSKQAQGGFPTKLGEYLASGKPVCVTTVGEIPDYLQDGESAFFAEPGSVESFAAAMRRALSDPKNALRVGSNGRKVAVKHFNKDIQAKILYDFLQELINNVSK